MMRAGHFTGMRRISQEDVIASVAGGPLRDRSKERLSSADIQIAHLYRVLLKSTRAVADGGLPFGYDKSVAHIVGISGETATGEDWRTLVPQHRPLGKADAA